MKYKKCHGRALLESTGFRLADLRKAEERIRQTQQGLGRPILAAKISDNQVVAVGNTLHYSPAWQTFPDFLADYIKLKLGREWGNAEIAKPLTERHPLMAWYDAYCGYQRATIKTLGEVHAATITGVVACYLGVAYALYLLAHNAELQQRLINRLKNPENFQGVYYELIVASILIRAGFILTLEDESDRKSMHCEFAAVSRKTGRRFSVEAKMRSVVGLLGRTEADGGPDENALSRLIKHLSAALKKPTTGERLIFIDLNALPTIAVDGSPDWVEPAMRRLERYEQLSLKAGIEAYVFVTNMAFHRQLDVVPAMAGCPFGLGISDFNRPGEIRITEAWRRKQKHIDAHAIGKAIEGYLHFPTTFDGRLPSESFGWRSARVVIGETYLFPEIGEGIVTAAAVNEESRELIVGATDVSGRGHLLRSSMSDDDLAEYKQFRDSYFGRVEPGPTRPKNLFELFEWFMDTQKDFPRSKILEWFASHPNLTEMARLDDDELRIAYCEALVAAINAKASTPQTTTSGGTLSGEPSTV